MSILRVNNIEVRTGSAVTFSSNIDITGSFDAAGIVTASKFVADTNATAADGGGNIYLNGNSNNNRIDFISGGANPPTFNIRSTGTKITLWPAVDTDSVDYAFGVDSQTLWYTVPQASQTHKWYGGTTEMMSLSNSNLTVEGNIIGIGSVGIGTDDPTSNLHVIGEIKVGQSGEYTVDDSRVQHNVRITSPQFTGRGSDAYVDIKGDAGATSFVRVLDSGNVGIGSTIPTVPLDVAGAIVNKTEVTVGDRTGGVVNDYSALFESGQLYLNKKDDVTGNPVSLDFLRCLQNGGQVMARINGDGSAEFAKQGTFGTIDLVSTTTSGTIVPFDGGIYVQRTSAENGSNPVFRGYLGTTVTSEITCGGAAYFTGTITQTQSLANSGKQQTLNKQFTYNAGDNGYIDFQSNGTRTGIIVMTSSTSVSYTNTSDYRLKENIQPITGATARLLQLKPCNFNWIQDKQSTIDGFIAHEVQDVVPEAVVGEKDAVDAEGNPEYQGIDQSKLVPLLTAALQEAVSKIESLETRISQLESN